MKTCNICGTEKDESEFYKPYAHCIICYNIKKRKVYKEKDHMSRKKYYKETVIERRAKKRIEEGVHIRKELRRLELLETKDMREMKRKEHVKEYRIRNREKLRQKDKANKAYKAAWRRNKMTTDICFAIASKLRTRINLALKTQKTVKCKSLKDVLGCTVDELKHHLESKFLPGMSWENHTRYGWHIDHIKPCTSFDLSNDEEQRKCFHYTNLQPLWALDNLTKNDKYTPCN